jgi:hypothetical protein
MLVTTDVFVWAAGANAAAEARRDARTTDFMLFF